MFALSIGAHADRTPTAWPDGVRFGSEGGSPPGPVVTYTLTRDELERERERISARLKERERFDARVRKGRRGGVSTRPTGYTEGQR